VDASTSGFALAEAFVRILPDADGFRATADRDLKAQMAGDKVTVPVGAETGEVIRKVADLKAILGLLTKRAYSARLIADDAHLQAQLAKIIAALKALSKRTAAPKVSLEGATGIETELLAIAAGLDRLSGKVARAHVEIDDDDAERRLGLLITQLSALQGRLTNLRLKVEDPDALARIAALKAALGSLHDQVVSINAAEIIATPDDAAIKHSLGRIAAEARALGLADLADVNVDPGKIQASLIRLKTLLARTPGGGGLPGLADLMDINIPPSVVLTQLARLKEAMGKSNVTLTDVLDVNLNDTQVAAAVAKLQKAFNNLGNESVSIGIPTLPALAEIAKLRAALGSLVDATDFGQVISAIEKELGTALRELSNEFSKKLTVKEAVVAGVDIASWDAAAAEIQKILGSIRLKALNPDFNQSQLSALVAEVQAKLNTLSVKALSVGIDQAGLDALIASIQAKLNSLHTPLAEFQIPDLSPIAKAEGLFADLVAEVNKVDPAMRKATTAAKGAGAGFGLLGAAVAGAGGWFGFLTGKVTLFGGAFGKLPILGSIGAWHLLAEAVIELGGTLIPAAIAFAAWGAAASQTAIDVYKRISSIRTATSALSLPLPGLSAKFAQMAASVQPQVYVLLGEALISVNSKAGAFQGVIQATGKVLDDLGARFTYAVTTGNTLSTVMRGAASDLAGWGSVIGNIGGIIGGVLKVLPGYAQPVLHALDDVTHALELLVNSQIGQTVLQWGTAFHGAIIWIGLLGTAVSSLIKLGLGQLGGLLTNIGTRLFALGGEAEGAGAALGKIGTAVTGLAGLPWGWIVIAAAGIAYLVYTLVTAKSAAQQFADAVQQNVITAAPLANLYGTITGVIAQTSREMAASTAIIRQASAATTEHVRARLQDSRAYIQAQHDIGNYSAVLGVATQDQQIVNRHIAEATGIFGTTTAAWSALNAAGVTSAQLLDTNKQHWAEALIEAEAYNQALRDVTGGSGRYLAAVNALNYANADQGNQLGALDADIAKVNAAQDQLIGTLVGAQLASDTYQQGLYTIAQNYNAAAGSGKTLAQQLASLGSEAKFAGATLTGTSQASVALNSAWYGQIQTAQKLFDALQLQNISTKDLSTVVATTAGQMLTWAGNNTEARGVIISLINDALGPGVVSFQNLDSWVAQNSTTMGGLNAIVAKTTLNASQLAGVLQGQLNQLLAQAAINARERPRQRRQRRAAAGQRRRRPGHQDVPADVPEQRAGRGEGVRRLGEERAGSEPAGGHGPVDPDDHPAAAGDGQLQQPGTAAGAAAVHQLGERRRRRRHQRGRQSVDRADLQAGPVPEQRPGADGTGQPEDIREVGRPGRRVRAGTVQEAGRRAVHVPDGHAGAVHGQAHGLDGAAGPARVRAARRRGRQQRDGAVQEGSGHAVADAIR
jgi:hypothetical protein